MQIHFNRHIFCFILIVCSLLFSSCMKNNENKSNDNASNVYEKNYNNLSNINWGNDKGHIIAAKYDNDTPAELLITTEYPANKLLRNQEIIGTIEEAELMCPAECVRRIDDTHYYTLHKSEEGGYLYTLYLLEDEERIFENDGQGKTDNFQYLKTDLRHSWYFQTRLPDRDEVEQYAIKHDLDSVRNMYLTSVTDLERSMPCIYVMLSDGSICTLRSNGKNMDVLPEVEEDYNILDYILSQDYELVMGVDGEEIPSDDELSRCTYGSREDCLDYIFARTNNTNPIDKIKISYPVYVLNRSMIPYLGTKMGFSQVYFPEIIRQLSKDEYYMVFKVREGDITIYCSSFKKRINMDINTLQRRDPILTMICLQKTKLMKA